MKNIELKEINHYYGKEQVLHDVNISIKEGEFFTLLGPSGCGKTTILRIIGGFIKPLSGSIYVGDKDITNLEPEYRNMGTVFQNYALFPNMTVEENVAYGLKIKKLPKKVIAEKGETWFGTRAMHSGMNKKKVAFFNKAIKAGENVYILFALSDNINNVRYIATVKEIYSSREEVTCPGDVSLVPKEYGQDEMGKIWFRITDLKETSIRAENLYFRSNDENVKERINVSQCHFGYVYEK